MTLKTSFKTHVLNTLISDLAADSENSYYLFISRPNSWSDDDSPPAYSDSRQNEIDLWNGMIAAKRIASVDAYLMIPKNDWNTGSTYGMYTSVDDLSGITYHITNSESNVYKCIFNGLSGGNTTSSKQSTDQPRGAATSTITTGDGFKWKFMYKIPESWSRFTTDDLIPVKQLKVDSNVPVKFQDDRAPQYYVQFNATGGAVDFIDVSNCGSSFGNNVRARPIDPEPANRTFVRSAGPTGASLSTFESNADDTYNSYVMNIVSGTGVGQSRRITDYNGENREVTVDPSWTTLPASDSLYEIMPEVVIDGDGDGAEARAVINNLSGVTLEAIDVINPGSGYTTVKATVKTTTSVAPVLDPILSPKGGHGSDPVDELKPSKLLLIVRLDREASAITADTVNTGSFPIVNDFRQYGILKNPVLAKGTRAGQIAGTDVDSITSLNVSAVTGSEFGSNDYSSGDIVVGLDSNACGIVTNWFRGSDIATGTINLTRTGRTFITGEPIAAIGTGGSDWSSSNKPTAYVRFQDETVGSQENQSSRLTTRLVIRATGGDASHNYTGADFDLDQVIRGASGSTATIVEFIPSGGVTGSLFVNTIVGSSGAATSGFSLYENLSGVTVSSSIETIDLPDFEFNSGKVIYINNTTPITRFNEQEEEIKIQIDL